MTRGFGLLRRTASLSAAFALYVSPLAAAQTPGFTTPDQAPASTALLSPGAFARLIHGPTAGVTVPVPKDPPRRDLIRQSTAAGAREARASSPQPPRRGGLNTAGKIVVGVGLVVGLLAGLAAASYYSGMDFMPLFDAIFGSR